MSATPSTSHMTGECRIGARDATESSHFQAHRFHDAQYSHLLMPLCPRRVVVPCAPCAIPSDCRLLLLTKRLRARPSSIKLPWQLPCDRWHTSTEYECGMVSLTGQSVQARGEISSFRLDEVYVVRCEKTKGITTRITPHARESLPSPWTTLLNEAYCTLAAGKMSD